MTKEVRFEPGPPMDLSGIETGDTIIVRGQRYECFGRYNLTSKAGHPYVALVFGSYCAECGAWFETLASVKGRTAMTRRCPEHAKGGVPVDGKPRWAKREGRWD